MKNGNFAMKKNFFKKHLLTCAAVLMLLALSTNLYAGTPAAPTWTISTQGTTYNTKPFLFWTAASSGSGWTINDAQIQIDDDSNFGSVNYDRTYYPTYVSEFRGLWTDWTSAATVIRHRVDTALAANTWYARVRVMDSNPASRNWSNYSTNWTFTIATISWTDSTISEGTTLIKAAHFTELRTVINNLRTLRNSGSYTWSTVTIDSTKLIKAVDMTDLRDALTTPYNTATGTNPTFTDTITAGTTLIRKTHIDELRTKVLLP